MDLQNELAINAEFNLNAYYNIAMEKSAIVRRYIEEAINFSESKLTKDKTLQNYLSRKTFAREYRTIRYSGPREIGHTSAALIWPYVSDSICFYYTPKYSSLYWKSRGIAEYVNANMNMENTAHAYGKTQKALRGHRRIDYVIVDDANMLDPLEFEKIYDITLDFQERIPFYIFLG